MVLYITLKKTSKGTKTIRKHLTNKYSYNTFQNKWDNENITNVDWKKVNIIINKSLTCYRLKWLQIRIVHKIITTNKSVSKFKENQSPMCTFCEMENEDITHLFYGCTKVKTFWKSLQDEIKDKCNISGNFLENKAIVLLGTSPNFYSNRVLDTVIVMAKMYIYSRKVNSTKNLHIPHFIKLIQNRYKMEKYNATCTNTTNIFNEEWKCMLPLIQAV